MCRYSWPDGLYKTHWVCLECFWSSKYDRGSNPLCPRCTIPLMDAGRDFKPPRKRDKSGWQAVTAIISAGLGYDSCGCGGPGYRPDNMAQLRQDLDQVSKKTDYLLNGFRREKIRLRKRGNK